MMMKNKIPQSFVMMLRRRYRVYFNPQGDGWYVAYNDGVQRQRRSLGVATKPEAEAAVKLLDEPPTAAQQAKHRASWSDVQKGFLQHKASLDKAPLTLAQYGYALDAFGRYIASKGVQYLDEVNLNTLEGFKAFETKQEGCDVSTAHHYSIIVKGAFRWASKAARGYLAVNPALDWETPEPVKPKRHTYSLPDVEKMETGVREWLRPVVTVLAWSGMRINELVNLRWQDVDLERRLLHIRVQESWKPKGRRDRMVPIHPKVDTVLRSQPIGTYVFGGPGGTPQLCARSCRRSLQVDQRRLGVHGGDLHAFRRFFATTMIRNGVDAETVRQWGGWKSFNTMLRYLADVNATDSVKAMDLAISRINTVPEKSDKEMTKRPA
jgi:integrase/recombinase XerD